MLTYDNQATCSLFFKCFTGSVIPHATVWAGISLVLTMLFSIAINPVMVGGTAPNLLSDTRFRYMRQDLFTQPYSHYIISYMLGFLMIFRVQLSYSRYWEGIVQLYESHNRLNCAASMVVAFDELAEGDVAIRGYAWRKHMMHLFSLLAGTQLLEIRFTDLELSELSPLHRVLKERPPQGKQKLNERILKRLIPPAPEHDSTGVSPELIKIMDRYPIEILDGVSKDEKSHLEMQAPSFNQAVNARIVRHISKRLIEGGLNMPPPIVSRIYQEIALGNTAFAQALKVSRIRFPFPYVQLLEIVKFFVICVTPLVVLSKTDVTIDMTQAWINTAWAMLHAFIVAFNFVAMTSVAQEMEDPFGVDANDLPLLSMHDELNCRLERLLNESPPDVDFAYNPKSKWSKEGRDNMFSALGNAQMASAAPSAGNGSSSNAPAAPATARSSLSINTRGLAIAAGHQYASIDSPAPTPSPSGAPPPSVLIPADGQPSLSTSPRSCAKRLSSSSPGARWAKAKAMLDNKAQLQV